LKVAQNQAIQICFYAVDSRGYQAFASNLIADPKLPAIAAKSIDRAFDGCVAMSIVSLEASVNILRLLSPWSLVSRSP
jgi:hypothetical protein